MHYHTDKCNYVKQLTSESIQYINNWSVAMFAQVSWPGFLALCRQKSVMDSDSDGVVGSRAPRGEAADDDSDGVVGAGPAASGRVRRRAGVGRPGVASRPRDPPKESVFSAFIVRDLPAPGAVVGAAAPLRRFHVSALCSCSYTYETPSDEAKARHMASLDYRPADARRPAPWGYLHYAMTDVWRLQNEAPVPDDVNCYDPVAPLELLEAIGDSLVTQGCKLRDVPHEVLCKLAGCFVFLTSFLDRLFLAPLPAIFRSWAFAVRFSGPPFMRDCPADVAYLRWRRDAGIVRTGARGGPQRAAGPTYEDALLQLPPPKRTRTPRDPAPQQQQSLRQKAVDPVHIINALFFRTVFEG